MFAKTAPVRSIHSRNYYSFFLLEVFVFLETFILICFFPQKVGVSPDSIFYIEGAKNLYRSFEYKSTLPRTFLEGPRNEDKFPEELLHAAVYNKKVPISHFPPGTSFVYSLSLYINDNLLKNIKIINVLLFFCFFFFFTFLVYFETNDLLISVLLSLCVFLTLPFTEKFYWAWSEPVFVVFNTLCFFALMKFIETYNMAYFILSFLFCAISYLVRFQGISNVFAGALIIFLYLKKRRFFFSSSWFLLSSIPALLLLLYNKMSSGHSIRYVYLYVNSISAFENVLSGFFYDWMNYFVVFEHRDKNFIRTMIFDSSFFMLILIVIVSILFIRNYKFWSGVIFVSLQSILIFASALFVNDQAPARYPMPLYPIIIFVLAVYKVSFCSSQQSGEYNLPLSKKFSMGLLAVFLLMTLPFKAIDFCKISENKFKDGLWFSQSDNYNSYSNIMNYIKYLSRVDNNKPLFFSNDYYLTYSCMFNEEIVVYPLPYTPDGLRKFLDLSRNINLYIFWKDGEKGVPIFDTNSKQFLNYEYDVNIIESFVRAQIILKILPLYGYYIYVNKSSH